MALPVDEYTERAWQTSEDPGTNRFAMVGLGWWAREQAIPAVRQSDFCDSTVLVSGSETKAEQARDRSDQIDATIRYPAVHDGAATDAYDAVYVCTPNAGHLPFVESAVQRGEPVL